MIGVSSASEKKKKMHIFNPRSLLLLLLCCAVAACGGNGGGRDSRTEPAPSALTYSSPVQTTVGQAMPALTPSVAGTVTSYSVAPALPDGLNINASTGVISGTPLTARTQSTYVVAASNAGGSTSFDLVLSVAEAPPSNLSYPVASLQAMVGVPVQPLTPMVSGRIGAYTVEPSLPAGLSLDVVSGVIAGVAVIVSDARQYVVTASNLSGSATFAITIAIRVAALQGDPSVSARAAIGDFFLLDPIASTEIVDDPVLGRIARTKIEITVSDTATVGEVNAAIASVQGQITSTLQGYAGIVLRIPDPGSLSALESMILALQARPGIETAEKVTVGDFAPNALPPNATLPLTDGDSDLVAARAYAVWNAARILDSTSGSVSFVQMDYFGDGGPGAGIAAALGTGFSLSHVLAHPHGYAVLSRALADFGGANDLRGRQTAIPPFDVQHAVRFLPIDLRASPGTEYDSHDTMTRLVQVIKKAPGKVVVNLSLGACPALPARCASAYQEKKAIAWLKRVRGSSSWLTPTQLEDRFLITASAGNQPGPVAPVNSPWNAAALLPIKDPHSTQFAAPADNVLAVESHGVRQSAPSEPPKPGCRSSFSSSDGNIAAFGETFSPLGVLVANDGATAAVQDQTTSGTSYAAPQVAGLALFLWRIDDSRSAGAMANTLINGGILNADCAQSDPSRSRLLTHTKRH